MEENGNVKMVQQNHHKMLGISLIEIMLAISIISLLASSGIYGWNLYRQRLALDNASAELMAFLGRVKQRADWTNGSYVLQTRQEGSTVVLDARHQHSQGDIALTFRYQGDSVALQMSQALTPVVFHGKRGMAFSGHFIVKNSVGQVRVIVSSRGRIRRCLMTDAHTPSNLAGIPLC